MAKKKYKRMTQAEKKMNKEVRELLREQGILPPVKPRLNRKKFLQETFEQWENAESGIIYYLPKAIACMVNREQTKITPEEVGVLKMMKLALETQAFEKRLEKEGKTEYSIGEYVEQVVKPVLKL